MNVNNERKKALLLGGTGAIGSYLAPLLESLGWDVDVTTRSARNHSGRHMKFIQGNAKDDDFLIPLLSKGYDVIVDFMVYKTNEFQRRIKSLLDSRAHYIFLSSYRVYGDNQGAPIHEGSPRLLETIHDEEYLSTDEYGLAKARQEDLLTTSKHENWTIIRPAITYSKERFQLGTMEAHEFLRRAIDHKMIVFPREMLSKRTTMTWAGDVATMVSLLLLNEGAYGETFIASTNESHTWDEVLQTYCDILDFKVKLISLEEYEEAIGRSYQIRYDRMFDRVIDNSKILNATGMKQKDLMPLREGLKIELASFSRQPRYSGENKKFEKAVKRMTMTFPQRLKRRFKSSTPRLPATAKEQMKNKIRESGKSSVCILTIQGHENYGCILQNYALQEKVKGLGCDVYTLEMERQRPFDADKQDPYHINCYEAQRNQMEFVEARITRSSIRSRQDIVLVGSDQVWNPFFNKGGRFWAKEFSGKKIAYAASFGDKGNDDLSDAYRGAVTHFVSDFDAVSVREPQGSQIVQENTGQAASVTCDPVLLHEVHFYEKIASCVPSDRTQFWFGYMIKDEALEKDVSRKAIELDIPFFNLNMYREVLSNPEVLKNQIVGKRYPKVEEWLARIRDAEIVFTSSFHAVVFSLLFHTDFYYLASEGHIDSRIGELLAKTSALDRAAVSLDKIDDHENGIDWEKVDTALEKMRKESTVWLKHALSE